MLTYIYRLYSDEELLYVGITNNLTVRLSNHRTNKDWWPSVSHMKITEALSLQEALKEENQIILTEHPRHNKRIEMGEIKQAYSRPTRDGSHRYNRTLPTDEVSYLNSLPTDEQVVERAYELYRAGWSMQSIVPHVRLRPSSAYLRMRFAETVPTPTGHPLPPVPETASEEKERKTRERGLGVRTSSRPLTPAEETTLRYLADLAKKYRPTYSAAHPTAVAVQQYKNMIKMLHDDEKITIPDIAKAAGVNPSTVLRRYKS